MRNSWLNCLRKISINGFTGAGDGNSLVPSPAFWRSSSITSDDGNDLLVGEQDGLEHAVFGHLAGEALDHGDRVAGAGDDQVQVALFQLRVRRHHDQFVADSADPDRPGRLEERDVRDVQGGTGSRSWHRMSGSFSLSADRTDAMTWTSRR